MPQEDVLILKQTILEKVEAYSKLPFLDLVREDIKTYGNLKRSVLQAGFWVVFGFRISHVLYVKKFDFFGQVLQLFLNLVFHCDISRKAEIGPRLIVYHPQHIFVGPLCRIGRDATLGPGVFLGSNENHKSADDFPLLGDAVNISPGAKIIGSIIIGNMVIVGPNAVVMKNIPSNSSVLPLSCHVITNPHRETD